jgi:hypothetical protein
MDPRVKVTEEELKTLFALENKLSGWVDASAQATLEAHSIEEQIGKLKPVAPAAVKDALEKLDKELAKLIAGTPKTDSSAAETGLDDVAGAAGGLYGAVGQADAAPTVAQKQACEETGKELGKVLHAWEGLKASSLAGVNSALHTAGLPELNLKQSPENMPDDGDED